MTTYKKNPKRGCGKKKRGGYYLEAALSRGGSLGAWTWILGNGIEGGNNILISLPARSMSIGNLAATLVLGEFLDNAIPVRSVLSPAELDQYEDLRARTGGMALFDHVGKSYYSPWEFASECSELGPSRRVPEKFAKQIVGKLPIPIVFSHPQIPLLKSKDQRDELVEAIWNFPGLIDYLKLDKNFYIFSLLPTWSDPEWGMRQVDRKGFDHFMAVALNLENTLNSDLSTTWGGSELALQLKPREELQLSRFSEIMGTCRRKEQLLGSSWITRASYVLKSDDDKEQKYMENAALGINVIDLDIEEEE